MAASAIQNHFLENLAKKFLVLASTSGEFALYDLDQNKFENKLQIEARPVALEWVGTSGALICGDANGEIHMFL